MKNKDNKEIVKAWVYSKNGDRIYFDIPKETAIKVVRLQRLMKPSKREDK